MKTAPSLSKIIDSRSFYDKLAPAYADISASRMPYLNAVDDLVIDRGKLLHVDRYLDIGCGDGRRTIKIASAIKAGYTLGIDESEEMLKQADHLETKALSIVNLKVKEQFDVATALWNVVGHIPKEQRQDMFVTIGNNLTQGGILMLDVNNSYNVSAYGEKVVSANKKVDENNEEAGDVVATHNVSGVDYSTIGHVFHPNEIDHLIAAVPDLEIKEKLFVDYSTGRLVTSASQGQLFYVITKL